MMTDLSSFKNSEATRSGTTCSSYILDLLLFVLIVVVIQKYVLKRFYAPFFTGEASAAFMQFTYYVEALKDGTSLYWDQYLMLSSQEMPMSPLLSPVTLLLTGVSSLFKIDELVTLAYLYAFISYAIQVLCAYSMYLLLRFLGLSRIAAIIGGVGYGFNYFISTFGMPHGYYRLSALAMIPIVFIFFIKLFSDKRNTLYYLTLSGFLLGITFVLNGDVKPTIYFIPVLVILAFVEGYEVHGAVKTAWLLGAVMFLGALITLAQFYPTLEALQEGIRNERTSYLPTIPLHPLNTLLGFSQNPFSFIMGFFFPHSFFEYYRQNLTLGIAMTHLHEQKFTYGIFLFLLSSVGVFYRTKRHLIWAISFAIFALYLLSSSTPLWPLFGFISEHAHLRYPTRAAVMLYFFLSIYAAYGVDVLLRRARGGSTFYDRWALRYTKYTYLFIALLLFAIIIAAIQFSFGSFGELKYSDSLTLFLSRLFIVILFCTLFSAIYISWKALYGSRFGTGPVSSASIFTRLFARFSRSAIKDFIFYTLLHALLSWLSLVIVFKLFKLWLFIKGATPEELSILFFVEATFPLATIIFTASYILFSSILARAFALLRPMHYVFVFLSTLIIFNLLFALSGALSAIHVVQTCSLVLMAAALYLRGFINKKYGPINIQKWKERPYFPRHSALVVTALFTVLFVFFIFSGLMSGYSTSTYLFWDAAGVMIQKEFLIVFLGLVLFVLTIIFGKLRATTVLVVLLSLGTYLYLYTESTDKRFPESLRDDQSLVFQRDAELTPIYDDNSLDKFRIYMPQQVMKKDLSPELGFSKSHHTYCCRQYKDKLRFAFGQIVSSKKLEDIRRTIYKNYSHPFWRLYNVGYIVDRFDSEPELLPNDPASFIRLSDMVIKLKDTRARLFFMDSYEYMDIDLFTEEVKLGGMLDMDVKLYFHDYNTGAPGGESGSGGEVNIEITDFRSGSIRAQVTAESPGFVVFSEVWAPSWTAYVDGEERDVIRAYGMLQALWVEEGSHEILFEYNVFQSWKMKTAVILTILAFGFVIVIFTRRVIRGLDSSRKA